MARKIKIFEIHPSEGMLGAIDVVGDFTKIFQGRFYLNDVGDRKQIYESATTPLGYEVVIATTFSIIGNAKYSGTYTVHTPIDSSLNESPSNFHNGKTTIRVNEPIGRGVNTSDSSDGYITNISTYLIKLNDREIALPPRQPFENTFDIKLYGKDTPNWGEGYAQNFASLLTNFSGILPPPLPEDGQFWFDKNSKKIKIWFDEKWNDMSISNGGNSSIFKYSQEDAKKDWVISHPLQTEAPYICLVQVYVDRGVGAQQIMPSKITYDNENQITITFSKAEKGWALLQA